MTHAPALRQLERLLVIMDRLRSPDGCPWDAAQTPDSLRPYLLEETYEVLEALDLGDPAAICEELGDLLLQIVFHARIASERGTFDMERVAAGIADKLERRHPQIFAGAPPLDPAEHHRQWETIKAAEKPGSARQQALDDGIPAALPPLQRAAKIVERARRNGSPLPSPRRVDPESPDALQGLLAATLHGPKRDREAACGDLLLALVTQTGLDLDSALRQALGRYVSTLSRPDGQDPD